MKLIRFRENGTEKPGIFLDEQFFDLRSFGEDYNEAFFETGGLSRLEAFVAEKRDSLQKLDSNIKLAVPFQRPSKIVCIGLNYADHAKETGATPPAEPVIFLKATTSLVGPSDPIVIPKGSVKTDWEVELAVVMGKKASYVSEEEAMDFVAGYCLHNDVSEREYQLERGGTWDKGKGCDSFAPMGPYLVTKDEISDVDDLRLWLKLNGQTMQDGTTANLIFKIPFLISYVSRFMTLLPGDVISTGTPAGVGLGMNPTVYLKPGDVVELGIDGLGSTTQNVVAYAH
ncbi:fumarylacetoacetate hydrolase family protein [Flavisolibacter nicotianae]|uniref:fumarylacetoacetate hydrolase family protein n=1 Tax=Flavisolibacter nicotianae TaxID=2364882 RepID=UPI000EAC2643|nr:fumarylacetoacetate hydrolase family protein [Flavisolibacter nicotianae]